jgi:putative RNA 2'-phosphotransferase
MAKPLQLTEMDKDQVRTSRFLSLILRHKPEEVGLILDASGWCRVDDLLRGCATHEHKISREELDIVVAENDKKRFEFSNDGERIRASQGHSIEVDLQYAPKEPPITLYHGTATRFLDSMINLGLIRGSRQHVHLSADVDTAFKVGERHGKPVVVPVRAGEMYEAGTPFYLTPNGVWLVEAVPPQYLCFDDLKTH